MIAGAKMNVDTYLELLHLANNEAKSCTCYERYIVYKIACDLIWCRPIPLANDNCRVNLLGNELLGMTAVSSIFLS